MQQGMDQEDEAEKQARERMERLKMKTGGNPKKPPNKPRTDDE